MSDRVTVEVVDQVAVITMDDGKANAQQDAFFDQMDAALDQAMADDVRAVVIAGRAGFFSGGLDLKLLPTLPIDDLVRTVTRFGDVMMRLYAFSKPVVAAVTGHALAGGAVLLLTADHRVGPSDVAPGRKPAKIGLNEVAIGIALPQFIVTMCDQNLSRQHRHAATVFGTVYTPDKALEVGYLQELVPGDQVVSTAMARAKQLGALPAAAFSATKHRTRGDLQGSDGAFTDELSTFLSAMGDR